jgi:hypothetical protein
LQYPGVHEWLEELATRLSDETGTPREQLELTPDEIDALLRFAGDAAHESGARTNAPLACFLVGVVAGRTGERATAVADRQD